MSISFLIFLSLNNYQTLHVQQFNLVKGKRTPERGGIKLKLSIYIIYIPVKLREKKSCKNKVVEGFYLLFYKLLNPSLQSSYINLHKLNWTTIAIKINLQFYCTSYL